jgi:hypothetical protein
VSPYEEAFNRIRAEFMEMPGMRLTPEQVERLSGVESSICRLVLDDLVRAGFLSVRASGAYARSTDLGRVKSRTAASKSSQHPTVGMPVPIR